MQKAAHTLFPFIPYSAWVALGLFVGPFFAHSMAQKRDEKQFWIRVLMMAAMCYALGKGIRSVYYSYGLQYLGGAEAPTKGLVHLFFDKASILLLIFVIARVSATLFRSNRWRWLTALGKTSLFAYCIHLLIIYNVSGPYLRQKLSPSGQAVYALVLTGVMYALVVIWRRWSPGMWLYVLKPALTMVETTRSKLRQ